MKWLPVLFYLGIAGWQVSSHFDQIFPSEPAKRAALRDCYVANPRFDPLDPAAQARCLAAYTPPPLTQANLMGMAKTGQGSYGDSGQRSGAR